jgi:glycosyltransferase involved in cell wall biosynthesis
MIVNFNLRNKMENIINTNLPLVTVITVVYNGAEVIEETIKSIIGQDYPKLEYIIIDGGSTDGTLDIIKKHANNISKFVSEKDEGIYDAMNKGILFAQGEWINFMNAGDTFVNALTIRDTFTNQNDFINSDVLVGACIVEFDDYKIKREPGSFKDLWKGTQFCHQATFIRTSIHKDKPYNISNKLVADFEFFYNAYLEDKKFFKINRTIAIYKSGGVSDEKKIEVLIGFRNTVLYNNSTFKAIIFYKLKFLNLVLKESIKLIVGPKLLKKIRLSKSK